MHSGLIELRSKLVKASARRAENKIIVLTSKADLLMTTPKLVDFS